MAHVATPACSRKGELCWEPHLRYLSCDLTKDGQPYSSLHRDLGLHISLPPLQLFTSF